MLSESLDQFGMPILETILRPVNQKATGDEGLQFLASLSTKGFFYRGMTKAEYDATVGAGRGIRSTNRHSLSGEGTSFSEDAETAESYVNFGRDDPRVTGRSNFLVQVSAGPDIQKKPDGYWHALDSIPQDRVTGVWEMYPEDGAILVRSV